MSLKSIRLRRIQNKNQSGDKQSTSSDFPITMKKSTSDTQNQALQSTDSKGQKESRASSLTKQVLTNLTHLILNNRSSCIF